MGVAEFGVGKLGGVRGMLDALGAGRVFLVHGEGSFVASGARETLLPQLAGRTVVEFSDFTESPKLPDVEKALVAFQRERCDLVIAVGGGTALDIGKLVNVFAHQEAPPLELIHGTAKIGAPGLPLLAIPTTAGTGSEATHFAVVYVDDEKYSVAHPSMLPGYAVIDPALTYDLSPALTATTGFDALCQAVESYWSGGATPASKQYAARAIRLILSALEQAVNAPDPRSRGRMALAAHLAGKAINISKTTAPHAISYPITVHFGVRHGHAVALTLGRFFALNAATEPEGVVQDARGPCYVQDTMAELFGIFGCRTARECEARWYALMAATGLPSDPAALGIRTPADVDLILAGINAERLGNNPVRVDPERLRKILA